MGHEVLMTYGLRNGTWLHVSEVERGLACNLLCYFCGARLIARRGDVRVPHLAHHSSECSWTPESLLHRLAKEIVLPGVQFVRPGASVAVNGRDLAKRYFTAEAVVLEPDAITVQAVSSEQPLEECRPDVLLVSADGGQLAIEIAVTHFVDRAKQAKLQRAGMPTVEIRLEAPDAGLPPDELAKLVLGGSRAAWVFHPKVEAARLRLRRELANQIRDSNRSIRERRQHTRRRNLVIQSSQFARRVRSSFWLAFDLWVYAFFERHKRPPTREEEAVFRRRWRN